MNFAYIDTNAVNLLTKKKAFSNIQNTKQITLKKLALKMKSFTFEFDENMNGIRSEANARYTNKNLWFKYILVKYPNLTDLSIKPCKYIHYFYGC